MGCCLIVSKAESVEKKGFENFYVLWHNIV